MYISRVQKDGEITGVVAYGANGGVFEPVSDYIDYLLEQLHIATNSVDALCYHLSRYFSHLEESDCPWHSVDDAMLEQFRDSELVEVIKNKRSRGSLSAKRTVNQRLRYVYQFYFWAQELGHLVDGLIGQDKPISSSLAGLADKGSRYHRSRLDRLCYPLCYPMVGTKSRFHPNVYSATTQDVSYIADRFLAQHPATAQRNLLILDMADQTGMRVESIWSLKTYQFDEDSKKERRDFVEVVPEKQKFGAQHSYRIPIELYDRVRRYIRVDRAQIMNDHRATERRARDHVFLSVRSASPIKRGSVVHIFSKAFKSRLAPKGAGVHALRRKRAQDVGDIEVAARKELGLPVSAHEVAFVIARELGQSTLAAQAAYVRRNRPELNDSYVGRLSREKDELAKRVRELESRLTALQGR